MTFAETLLPEFEQEMRTTRQVLERVPDGKGDFRPHPKSFSLAHLAQLVAVMPGWHKATLREDKLDLASSPGYSNESTATLLERFDTLVGEAKAAITATKDEDLEKPWSLTNGAIVLFTLPRGVVTRMNVSHQVHHRAQLALYLRMLDVPVPSIYGPTADEPWGAGAAAGAAKA